MDKKTEALKLALEALELANYYVADYCNGNTIEEIDDAITAIREALAEQPAQQGPVVKKHEPIIDLDKYAGTYGGYIEEQK